MTSQVRMLTKLSTARVAVEGFHSLMMGTEMSVEATTAIEKLPTGLTFEANFPVNRIYVEA